MQFYLKLVAVLNKIYIASSLQKPTSRNVLPVMKEAAMPHTELMFTSLMLHDAKSFMDYQSGVKLQH